MLSGKYRKIVPELAFPKQKALTTVMDENI